MFTQEEYKVIADLLDNVNLQGTIYTLPARLSFLTQLRIKLKVLMEEGEQAKDVELTAPTEIK